jgi:serine/threonine-protein kinase
MGSYILDNRYCLLHSIKQNDYGQTFLAADLALERQKCIIKKLLANARDVPMAKIRELLFDREARILQKLKGKHDQIPKFYRYFNEPGAFYLVQEWIKGITLQQRLNARTKISEWETRRILLNLLPVLDCIHGLGIVHRDLKPNNIILRYEDRLPVLIDFGVAKEIDDKTTSRQLLDFPRVGTPGYMSPEQIMGKTVYSSDLYSLGAIAIHLLTGISPQSPKFSLETCWHPFKATLSSNLGEVIDRAITLEPSNRYTSAREMLSALQSPSTIYLMTSDTNDEPKSLKPRSKLTFAAKPWLLWLIFAGELAALWFGLTYLIPTPDYRSSISNVWEFSLGESPIVMPNDESTDLVLDNRPNFPLFATGTLATTILEKLGQPIARQPGYWSNSIAWSYKNISASGIDLGYLFDLQTQKLRQTEVAVPPETNLATLQYTLQELIPQGKSLSIDTGLQSVYNRQIDRYSFTVGSLEGIVERNSEDRIYIGIWEADFH